MPDDIQRPPDMAGLGPQQPAPAEDAVGLLRSQGTPPASLLSLLAQPQGGGGGLAGAISAGMPFVNVGGRNAGFQDVVAQQQERARLQQRQQFEEVARVQAMQERQQERLYRQNKDFLMLYEQGLTSGSPIVREWSARGLNQILPQMNQPKLPPDVVQGFVQGRLSPDILKQAIMERRAGIDDKTLLAMHRELQPSDLAFVDKLKDSPDYMRSIGVDEEEVQRRRDEFVLKRRAADLAAQRADLSERRLTLQEERSERAEERAQRNEARNDRRLDIMEKSLASKLTTKEEKRKLTFDVMADALDNMEALAQRLDDKNYLPKTAAGPLAGIATGDLSAARATINQTTFPNDGDWQAWKQLQASLVGFDRTVLNDIGARAFQAFKNQFAFFDHPPTRDAIIQSINQMRGFLKTAQEGRGEPTAERITIRVGKDYYTKDWRRGDPLPPGAEIIKVE